MASIDTIKVAETTRVTPSSDSPKSATEFSLPLTLFDTMCLKFQHVERVFFYPLNESISTPENFYSTILPKLKHSLSFSLIHFLPLAGKLRWPSGSPKPIIIYTPKDGVSLTVAESNSDFTLLSTDQAHQAIDLHPLVPQLMVTNDEAAIFSLKITLFPRQGFSIGTSSHHAVLDGRSSIMFFKAWAHLCKQGQDIGNSCLPVGLTPFYDRNVIEDPTRLDLLYLNQWLAFTRSDSDPNGKSLKLLPNFRDGSSDLVRATFDLSRQHINKLREKVLSKVDRSQQSLRLSSFVLTLAYISTCRVKARGDESDENVVIGFAVDCRERLRIPHNYFGNCISIKVITSAKARNFTDDNGLTFASELFSDMITEIETKGVLHEAEKTMTKTFNVLKERGTQMIFVAGSPRLGVYEADFGWGKPGKVEVVSIDWGGEISLAEDRDGNGGIEIGVVLKKLEMKTFASLFMDGIKDH